MKRLILLLILLAAGWYAYGKLKERATPEAIRQSEPVKYVTSLQSDVRKAEQAAQKYTEKAREGARELEKGLKEPQ